MATYRQISDDVRTHSGFTPKTCWIAHVKELNGIPIRRAWNRAGDGRGVPCPPDKRPAVEASFRRLALLP